MRMYHMGGWGYGGYMGSSFLCTIIAIVVFIDLVLVGVWLWQKIKKEDKEANSHHKHE